MFINLDKMKLIIMMMIILILQLFTTSNAQIRNKKTESVSIFGNCGMCEATIEEAGNRSRIAKVDWNKETKLATITFDTIKTNQDEILKRIALSGYDSEKYLAPNDAYAKLPECCKYERKAQAPTTFENTRSEVNSELTVYNHSSISVGKQEDPQLKAVFENYFGVKDALIKTDGSSASAIAIELVKAINAVKIELLSTEEQPVWMKVRKDVALYATQIADTRDASNQRSHFMLLSKNMFDLIKVSKNEKPIYYQYCPMANDGKGANWLSKDEVIRNPYYGNQMLTCGKTVEILK